MVTFKTGLAIYTVSITLLFLSGGSAIRLYGETCGVNPLIPSTWFRSFILVGSPWCKFLNWIGYLSNSIMEMFWYHMATIIFGFIGSNFNGITKKIPNRSDPLHKNKVV